MVALKNPLRHIGILKPEYYYLKNSSKFLELFVPQKLSTAFMNIHITPGHSLYVFRV